jgi:hypothetical protein
MTNIKGISIDKDGSFEYDPLEDAKGLGEEKEFTEEQQSTPEASQDMLPEHTRTGSVHGIVATIA